MSVMAGVSLRERKKEQTRRALADAARRLVATRGFAGTTVADIAAEADVSPRTFFSYFAAKEDALFLDTDRRLALLDGLVLAGPPTPPMQALRQVVEQVVTATEGDLFGAAGAERAARVKDSPELAAAGLRRLQSAQRHLTAALRAAYPEMGRIDAVAMTGAVVGALVAVVTDQLLDPGGGPAAARKGAGRALDLVERGAGGLPA